ncbi:YdcF family protein [Candidatus Puniceispirillum sp.]|nr:YdcF family protein [Candidatus Puniceispirillum sp.]
MFFILSKSLSLLLEPLVIPYLLFLLGLIARWRRWGWIMRISFTCGITLPIVYGILPLSSLPLQFLEGRVVRGEIGQKHIDGIIVLGGFSGDGVIAKSHNQYGLGSSAERFTAAVALTHQLPKTPILFSGFSGALVPRGWRESDNIRDLVHQLGGLNTAVFYEENSRNTYENAVNSRQIFVAEPGTNWILVTSANHMPRAIGSFAAAGWTGIIPYPVDYQTPKTGYTSLWDIQGGVSIVRQSLHEYVGLLAYYLSGRSTTLLPK